MEFPPKFDGTSSKTREFLEKIALFFTCNSDTYVTDVACVSCVRSLLEGQAHAWSTAFIKEQPSPSLATFVSALENMFGNPRQQEDDRYSLSILRQTSDLNSYITRFKTLAMNSGYNEQTLIFMFKAGLQDNLHLALATSFPMPSSLSDTIERCSIMDGNIRTINKRRQIPFNQRHTTPPSAQPPVPPRYTPPPPLPQIDHMDLDTLSQPRGPLSQEEKDRRNRLNLCRYCGGEGHIAISCPKKKTRVQLNALSQMSGNVPDSTL
jgi:hypothetical protein